MTILSTTPWLQPDQPAFGSRLRPR